MLPLQEAMRLSDEQKTNLLKARNTYLTEVGRLLEERRRLQTILRVRLGLRNRVQGIGLGVFEGIP